MKNDVSIPGKMTFFSFFLGGISEFQHDRNRDILSGFLFLFVFASNDLMYA